VLRGFGMVRVGIIEQWRSKQGGQLDGGEDG
jgi:hypothetical protein